MVKMKNSGELLVPGSAKKRGKKGEVPEGKTIDSDIDKTKQLRI